MCELFGASSVHPIELNGYLREFYSHCDRHPNGWGLALLDGSEVFLEKEPLRADKSSYLRARLSVPVLANTVLAHIRYATIGNEEYRNCHPFTGKDCTGRRWTLIHNGTIFDYEPMNGMTQKQLGDTDSERILLYVIEQINRQNRSRKGPGTKKERGTDACGSERFALLDRIVCEMSRGNKLNLILYDGELMYVHTNYSASLYRLVKKGQVIFSTRPLGKEEWEPVPMTTLLAFRDGELVFTGTNHGETYVDSEEKTKFLYQIFSGL